MFSGCERLAAGFVVSEVFAWCLLPCSLAPCLEALSAGARGPARHWARNQGCEHPALYCTLLLHPSDNRNP